MKQFAPVIIVGIIFVLSLGGAIVLFRFLKSSAMIRKAGYQAGGALAGFLLIYGTLYYSSANLSDRLNAGELTWTVVGVVQKAGARIHDGVSIKQIPPTPQAVTDIGGNFRLPDLRTPKDQLPELQIESDGYLPRPVRITPENANVDPDTGVIRLKEPVRIARVPQ